MTTQQALLDRLRADPTDESTWSVLRDLLLGEGDPRGVLMVAGDVARVQFGRIAFGDQAGAQLRQGAAKLVAGVAWASQQGDANR